MWTVSDISQGVSSAIRNAARATGAGFDYLLNTAQRESGLKANARNSASSATGLYQFTEQTWLQMVKQEGPRYGLANAASAIDQTSSGRFVVSNPSLRSQILALRSNPQASALMAGAFTERNRQSLMADLGRTPTNGELYAAHFLGAQGASQLVQLADARPNASAARYFPEAAGANRSIFYDGSRPRSTAEVYNLLAKDTRASSGTGVAGRSIPELNSETTLTASAYAEEPSIPALPDDGQVFHSMFRSGRRSPVSSYVEAAWSSLPPGQRNAIAAAPVQQTAPTPPGRTVTGPASMLPVSEVPRALRPGAIGSGPLDLYSFLKPGVAGSSGPSDTGAPSA